MKSKFLFSILFFLILTGTTFAQSPYKIAKRATAAYQKEQYALAIDLYEKALSKETNSAWLYKLGNCYRILNRTEEAEFCFKRYFQSSKRPNTRAHYYYATALIGNKKYELAKKHLKEFILLDPIHGTNADYLLENIDNIKNIQPYYHHVDIKPFPFNSKADEHGAVFWQDAIIFVSDRKRGFTLFKQKAGHTGREFLTLYQSNGNENENKNEYDVPKLLPRKINALNRNVGSATFSINSNTMIFAKNDTKTNSKGTYPMQLFQAVFDEKRGKWSKVDKLNFCSPNINYMHPAVSVDGKHLVFTSKISGGKGGMDLYISKKMNGKWSRPKNLGGVINTSSHEGFPFFDTEGKLYFCSKGHLGFGGFDIFVTEQDENGTWQTPINLGAPINSSQDDISFCLDESGTRGIVASSRNSGDDDLFIFEIKIPSSELQMNKNERLSDK